MSFLFAAAHDGGILECNLFRTMTSSSGGQWVASNAIYAKTACNTGDYKRRNSWSRVKFITHLPGVRIELHRLLLEPSPASAAWEGAVSECPSSNAVPAVAAPMRVHLSSAINGRTLHHAQKLPLRGQIGRSIIS